MTHLKPGESAPDFTLPSERSQPPAAALTLAADLRRRDQWPGLWRRSGESAEEGEAWDLVSKIAEADAPLVDQAVAYARSITQFSPVAIEGVRRCVAAAGPVVTEQGLDVELREVDRVGASEDARAGVAAFLEKRPAVFKGR